jgi:hypothetical protein
VSLSTDGPATATLTSVTKVLCYGKGFPITFAFANAGQLSMNVPLKTPAERTGTRPTIEIQPPHPTPLWESGAAHEAAPESSAAAGSGASAAPGTACDS